MPLSARKAQSPAVAAATADAYTFRPVVAADFPMLERWLNEEHVRRWWPDPAEQLRKIAGAVENDAVDAFVVSFDGRPIGYLQVYDVHAEWALGCYADQPKGTRGIDQFIGEVEMVGRGHGPRFIGAACERLFHEGATRVVTDPDPANGRAFRAYQKAGFRVLGERMIPDGPVVLMARDRAV